MTQSRKGNKANVERKLGDCWQWQATGPCSKGYSCGLHHGVGGFGDGSEPHRQKERTSEEEPNKKTKKGGAKGSVAILKESIEFGLCISRFLSEKIYST